MDETRLEELVDRISAFSDQCRLDAANARNDRKFIIDFMLAIQGPFIEFVETRNSAAFKSDLKKLADKQTIRSSVDYWFWRPETSMEFRNQLRKRANYLKTSNYTLDQAWDLLVDYVAGWTGRELDEALLKSVLAGAYK
jgi:hypothetical protein